MGFRAILANDYFIRWLCNHTFVILSYAINVQLASENGSITHITLRWYVCLRESENEKGRIN